MPNWAIHLIVPLLALLVVSRKEDHKYIILLLPLAVVPDLDTFLTQHRALLHNMFIPVVFFILGWKLREYRTVLIICAVYFASHVVLDMFGGGVVLFYPFYDRMAFVNASLSIEQPINIIWTFDYGFDEYDSGWKTALGYITDSPGTGAILFILFAGIFVAYRRLREDKRR
jgi:small basic protein